MNEELDRRLREEELAFFGRISADISHEMRNILSVIGEYAGLLDDLLALAEDRRPLDVVKLKTLAARIVNQVRNGTAAMERFSRFAHATDEKTASFDLTALAANMADLAQRSATLAGCRLEAKLPATTIPVRTNPFSLQYAVFSAIQLILKSLERGALATIELAARGPAAVISISGSTAVGDGLSGDISQLSPRMNELEGTIETTYADGAISLTLTIPI